MPELAEVEIVRRNCERWWRGRRVIGVEVLDDALDADALGGVVGAVLVAAHRRGKRLALELDGDRWLALHLRMTGKLVRGRGDRDRVRFALEGGDTVAFKDVRRLGSLDALDGARARAWLSALGPEPWPEPLSAEALRACLAPVAGRQLKSALLDQAVVAGLGNIAVCESLWRAGLAPTRKAESLDREALDRLARAFVDHVDHVLDAEDGAEVTYIGEAGAENPFLIYGRAGQPCPRCEREIVTARHGGRVTYLCACQR